MKIPVWPGRSSRSGDQVLVHEALTHHTAGNSGHLVSGAEWSDTVTACEFGDVAVQVLATHRWCVP